METTVATKNFSSNTDCRYNSLALSLTPTIPHENNYVVFYDVVNGMGQEVNDQFFFPLSEINKEKIIVSHEDFIRFSHHVESADISVNSRLDRLISKFV